MHGQSTLTIITLILMLKPLVTTPIHRQTGQWGENEVVRNPPLLPILLNKGHQSLKKKKTRYMFECPLLQVTSCYCLTEEYIDISLWWKVKALNVSQFQFRLLSKFATSHKPSLHHDNIRSLRTN